MTTREQLHQLIDQLQEDKLPAVVIVVQDLLAEHDPVERMFDDAPEDEEPLTPEDIAAIERGKADLAAGRVYTMEEVCRELDIPLP